MQCKCYAAQECVTHNYIGTHVNTGFVALTMQGFFQGLKHLRMYVPLKVCQCIVLYVTQFCVVI